MDQEVMGVANFVNKNNGMKYTLRSTCLKKTIDDYISKLKNGIHPNEDLQTDFNKGDNIQVEIVKLDCKDKSEVNRIGKEEIERNGNKSYNIIKGDVSFEGGNPNPYPTKTERNQNTPLGTISTEDIDELFNPPETPSPPEPPVKHTGPRYEDVKFPKIKDRKKQNLTDYTSIPKRTCQYCGNQVFDFVKRCPYCNNEVVGKNSKNSKRIGSVISNKPFPKHKASTNFEFKRKKCVNCGRLLKCTTKSCPYCRSKTFVDYNGYCIKTNDDNQENYQDSNFIEAVNVDEDKLSEVQENEKDKKLVFKRKICLGCGRSLKCVVKKCPYCSSTNFTKGNCKKETKKELPIKKEETKIEEKGVIFKRKRCKNCGRQLKENVKKCMYCNSTDFSEVKIYKKEDLPIINKKDNSNAGKRKSSVTSSGHVKWKVCDNCHKKVNKVAKSCPYCGHDLSKLLNHSTQVKEDSQTTSPSNDDVKFDSSNINQKELGPDEIAVKRKQPKKSKGLFGRIKGIFRG